VFTTAATWRDVSRVLAPSRGTGAFIDDPSEDKPEVGRGSEVGRHVPELMLQTKVAPLQLTNLERESVPTPAFGRRSLRTGENIVVRFLKTTPEGDGLRPKFFNL